MIHEIFLPESPKNNSFKELTEEEALREIFPQNIEPMEIQDDINVDNLYYLNNQPKKDLTPQKSLKTQNQFMDQNDNPFLFMDDYESFYNKFADIKEVNNIELEKDDCKSPCFTFNLEFEKKLIYSSIDDEMLINVENQSLKAQNEEGKVIEIVQEKKEYKNSENNKKKLDLEKKETKANPQKNIHRGQYTHLINKDDKFFPFTSGKGLKFYRKILAESLSPNDQNNNGTPSQSSNDSSSTSRQGFTPPKDNIGNEVECCNKDEKKESKDGQNKEEYKETKPNEDFYNYNEQMKSLSDNFILKFTTKKYFVAPNGKKKRVKKKRKFKPDDIRKKIKARFHKALKNIINENLKKAGSKELFDFLPQCFIGNVSKKMNAKYFDSTYKELLSTDFLAELNKEDYRNSKVDHNKYIKNLQVLDYLEKNPDICEKSGFDLIKDRKYKDILKIYFTSAQFENSLIQLKLEKESPEYIQEYIHRAKSYVNFYSNVNNKYNKKNETDENDEEENEEDQNNDEKDN